MAEYVVVRQNNKFKIEFQTFDPQDPNSGIQSVVRIHDLTPYTMLLASLGACTTIVLNTYAQNHAVDLHEVEVHVQYQRVFQDDCENCEEIEHYEEKITETLTLIGDLTDKDRQKLFRIAQQCSVHKMLEAGIKIQSRMNS